MLLSECRPGQAGVITGILGNGPLVQRLMEMGLVAGTRIRVLRLAPLGDPMEVELHDYFLSLRRSEADAVEVEI
ncbi:MAG: FeoA family protein [Candidatus Eisenbacteria bacterium]